MSQRLDFIYHSPGKKKVNEGREFVHSHTKTVAGDHSSALERIGIWKFQNLQAHIT